MGSKIFTQFPRPRSAPAAFFPGAVGATTYPIQKIPEAHSASGIFICLIFLIVFYLSISIRWDSGVPK